MQIIKKNYENINREDAHGGQGGRRLYVENEEIKNVQGMTYGYLPAGSRFSWHMHEGINEVMLVLKGKGIVRDHEGEYEYKEGDFFIFPKEIEHEIENTGTIENEYVFVRVKE